MRRIHPFQGACCGDDLAYSCILCTRISCLEHDPSPGEINHICDLCWNPIDYPEAS